MRLMLYGTETDRDEFMCSVTALPVWRASSPPKASAKMSRCCGFRMITVSACSLTGSAVHIFIKSLFPRRSSLRRLQDACKGVTR